MPMLCVQRVLLLPALEPKVQINDVEAWEFKTKEVTIVCNCELDHLFQCDLQDFSSTLTINLFLITKKTIRIC